MKKLVLTDDEADELYICVLCRLGIIETGTPILRAKDAVESGQQNKLKALGAEQMKLILTLENLLEQLF